jgi:recombination protein RecA
MKSGTQTQRKPATKPWTQLDQALRATDLLLQAGGFAAIVFDLGDTAAEYAVRIPLATWFRFRQAADRTRTCLVVVAHAGPQRSIAQSSAAAVLDCAALSPVVAGETVLRGFRFQVRSERQRFSPFVMGQKRPPASAWPAVCAWDITGANSKEQSA